MEAVILVFLKVLIYHFYETYGHEIWQAGTSTGFDSNKTNQAGPGDVIMSRSSNKLKTYLR